MSLPVVGIQMSASVRSGQSGAADPPYFFIFWAIHACACGQKRPFKYPYLDGFDHWQLSATNACWHCKKRDSDQTASAAIRRPPRTEPIEFLNVCDLSARPIGVANCCPHNSSSHIQALARLFLLYAAELALSDRRSMKTQRYS